MPPDLSTKNLQELLHELHLPVTDSVLSGLEAYLRQLLQWNRAINLTGLKDWPLIVRKLFVDSFYLADLLQVLRLPEAPCICDLGAGAGLPGIPLRLLYPDGNYLMIEKRAKRAGFLRNLLARLPLARTQIVQADIADFARQHPFCADLVLSRAFLPFPALSLAAKPFLKSHGYLVVLSSKPFSGEQAPGWTAQKLLPYHVEHNERWLWALQVEETPAHLSSSPCNTQH
ncbi:MAG: 16S rRNA (guanine(527)-N(7))-methyltransferase RsmG [Desulfovibrio sp.]|nr:16S rRNA (guanine(527)-N(7))-methyltransferase RsmG [Desulfovibrio sp.]